MLDKKGPFGLATGERDGLAYFLSVRQKFTETSDKERYPWLLTIQIDSEGESQLGLVSDDEAEVLNLLEDFFEEKLSTLTEMFFVGRITWNRTRSLYYYIEDPKPVAGQLEKLIQTGQYAREFEYRIEKDPDWKKMSEIVPNIENI
jgi:hypothetical protein